MRLVLDPRARRLIARMPRTSWFALSELLLLGLLAWQGARLAWAIVTPVDPIGAWRPAGIGAAGDGLAIGGFDPFFRLADTAPVVVAAADLKLFGVRADQATGRGSAIIELPGGLQQSFAVGDELLPGVRLEAVQLDGVTILRNGAREQLFLDQSRPVSASAPMATPTYAPAPLPVAVPGGGATRWQDEISASPQIRDGAVIGFTLQPKGGGEAFRAAGLQPGDVLVSVNGQRILNADSMAALPGLLSGGQAATLEVERGGRTMTLSTAAGR